MGKKIVLASSSPRRKELLSKIIPEHEFIVIESNIQEKILEGENAESFCMRIAEEKARDVIKKHKGDISDKAIVIGADTVILFDNEIIGQPKDKNDAKKILEKLSGKKHEVITGIAIISVNENKIIKFTVKSTVWIKKLSDEEILEYINSDEPMDKAGAYAIQGLGKNLIEKFEGSYTNIIGLPIDELRQALYSFLEESLK
jgi:septum formation protein